MRRSIIYTISFIFFLIHNVFTQEKNELKFLDYDTLQIHNLTLSSLDPYNEDLDSNFTFEEIVQKKGYNLIFL